MKLTIEVPEPPAGYEYTVEFRRPTGSEVFRSQENGKAISNCSTFGNPRFILRPVWQAPEWIPEGCWLFEAWRDHWYAKREEPNKTGDDYYSVGGAESLVAVPIVRLAALHKGLGVDA
jgi:hypothetical protein